MRTTAAVAVSVVAALALAGSATLRSSARCPQALPPGPDAAERALAAVRRAVPRLYRGREFRRYDVTSLASLRAGAFAPRGVEVYRGIAAQRCGRRVAARSWLALLSFPDLLPSASLSQGVVYAARTPRGWRVWYRYR